MKYAVVVVTDSNFNIHSEHGNLDSAIAEFHGYCKALWNDKDTKTATVKIMDEDLSIVGNYTDGFNRGEDVEPAE